MLLKSLVLVYFLANGVWAACNNDNLLNAFIKSPSQAAAFCSTYTQGPGSPLPTFVPTTYANSRYSSACSCIATTTSSTLKTTASTTATLPTTTLRTTSTCGPCPVCDPYYVTVTVSVTPRSSYPSTVTITDSCSTSSAPAPSCTLSSNSCSGTCTPADFASDILNCGSCGFKCPPVGNGLPSCVNGVCGIASCNPGFANCNKNAGDGCEVNLMTDKNNCGYCGHTCGDGVFSPSCCQNGICQGNC